MQFESCLSFKAFQYRACTCNCSVVPVMGALVRFLYQAGIGGRSRSSEGKVALTRQRDNPQKNVLEALSSLSE